MIYWFLIILNIFVLKECREDFKIITVNMTDGKRDISIIGLKVNNKYKFKIISGFNQASFVARATLIEQINSTGWGHLVVQSSPDFSDELQAYFSGVVEGIITQPLISAHWLNTYEGYCSELIPYCIKLHKYLKENFLSLVKKTKNSSGFLKMIRLQLWQIKGLQDGYDGNWKKDLADITETHLLTMQRQILHLYLLQADCDLSSLSAILGGSTYHNQFTVSEPVGDGRCSALIKYVKGSIFTAHVTWCTYNIMLRLTKLYDFPYRINEKETSSPFIPAQKISFSSYPGQIASLDDFYITSGGLVVIETTLGNYNNAIYEPLKNMASEIILSYARAQAANRLSNSGEEWSKIFSMNNSGTYNNQWMVVDNNVMKNHHHGERIPNGALYIIEQLPGLVISEDITESLRTLTYWSSYNLPYNKTIWDIGGFQSIVNKNGEIFDYYKCPRRQMFKNGAPSVVDHESLMRLMRYNDFMNDPLAKCNCSPPYNGLLGISSRSDLNLKSGIYPDSIFGYRLYGGVDLKFTTSELSPSMKFVAINGPTYDQQPVFDWSKITDKTLKHNMQPIKFQFPPVLTPFT